MKRLSKTLLLITALLLGAKTLYAQEAAQPKLHILETTDAVSLPNGAFGLSAGIGVAAGAYGESSFHFKADGSYSWPDPWLKKFGRQPYQPGKDVVGLTMELLGGVDITASSISTTVSPFGGLRANLFFGKKNHSIAFTPELDVGPRFLSYKSSVDAANNSSVGFMFRTGPGATFFIPNQTGKHRWGIRVQSMLDFGNYASASGAAGFMLNIGAVYQNKL